MTPITITFEGAPVPKGRARFGGGHVFTPKATRGFQYDFGWCAKAAMAGRKPFQCAVKITALFELTIPAARSARARADAVAGLILPTAKPDLDNLVKAAIDACNGIVFADDAQITEIGAEKIYGIAPKTVLTISMSERSRRARNSQLLIGGNQQQRSAK
jgi:Holliday junction resolvase RusA-like endonuclease